MKTRDKVTRFRQGKQWIISRWDEHLQGWVHSHPMDYWQAYGRLKDIREQMRMEKRAQNN